MTGFDGRVAGAGRLGAVPLSASEPTHDPKAGVRHVPVSADPADSATAISDADDLEPYLAEQMNDPEFVQGFAVAILANLPRIGGSAANANWMNARRAVKALSDAGLDIVKRPIGPQSPAPTSPESH